MSSGMAARAAEQRKHSGAEAIHVFFYSGITPGCEYKLKGSGHLIWPSELDFGTGQCWSYLDEILAIIFDDIILDL